MAHAAAGRTLDERLRLQVMIWTGMVMFVFLTMHLTNLALGLISLQTMEDWRWTLSGVWSSVPPLRILLMVSLVAHFIAALISLYHRNTLRLPAYDMAQLLAGVLIVPLLAYHVFGVMAVEALGLRPTYALVLGQFWVVSPVAGLQQVALIVVAWIHGAIGIFTWLNARGERHRALAVFRPLAVALPIVAMLGYVEAGQQVIPVEDGGRGSVLINDPNAAGPTVDPSEIPGILATAQTQTRVAAWGSLGVIGLVLVLRWMRLNLAGRDRVAVTYAGRRQEAFVARTGLTLLEMARAESLAHASKCRGRGRCGTCRVRVLAGAEHLPPPTALEADVLARWSAGPDERLACQLKPRPGALTVERVVSPDLSDAPQSAPQRASRPAAEAT